MTKDIYEPPSSDLTATPSGGGGYERNKKRAVIAFWITPILTLSPIFGAVILYDGIWESDIIVIAKLFFEFLVFTYIYTYLFFSPLHWNLVRVGKPYFYIYLLAGLIFPIPIVWISGEFNSISAWILTTGTGAAWSVIFWFIAVYLGEETSS